MLRCTLSRRAILVVVFLSLVNLSFAACECARPPPAGSLTAPASSTLCKCACFGKSILIPLDGKPKSSPAGPVGKSETKQGHGTCLECNKLFCQNYNLPICKDAKDGDFFATCYRKIRLRFMALQLISTIRTGLGQRSGHRIHIHIRHGWLVDICWSQTVDRPVIGCLLMPRSCTSATNKS
jgi:hypothetical protein